MGNWSEHGSATGGNYICNVYDTKIAKSTKFSNEEKKRADAAT